MTKEICGETIHGGTYFHECGDEKRPPYAHNDAFDYLHAFGLIFAASVIFGLYGGNLLRSFIRSKTPLAHKKGVSSARRKVTPMTIIGGVVPLTKRKQPPKQHRNNRSAKRI